MAINRWWRRVVQIKKIKIFNLVGGFWANGIMTGACFWWIIWRHHPIPSTNILARSIFGFYARICVFRALD